MDDRRGMDGKQFVVSMIDVLRWPIAFVAAVLILREPLSAFLRAVTASLTG
ncbi:hypothetical protein [uncultured Sphingomonas sp.]|uniref:hypothetical protein n=1 Tax=uncultured Sphingomonas sp. TaxID=158754 RepID=UPI0035CBA2FE